MRNQLTHSCLAAVLLVLPLASRAQNVGIGTTTPLAPLSITPSGLGAKLTLWDAGSTTQHYGFGISSNQLNYQVQGTADHVFSRGGKNNDGTEMMRLQGTTGNLGIGINSPAARLDVEGGGLLVGGFTAISAQGAHLQWNRTGFEGETWLINQYGIGTAQNFGIRFGNSDQSNTLTEWARFDKLGNFSIGVPFALGQGPGTSKLDVNGSTRLRGLTTAGFVTTDASGNLSSASTASFGTSFIQNQTASAQTGGFSVSGAGTVGGALQAGTTLVADGAGANTGSLTNALRFGNIASGEGIASKRTSTGNQSGLDFYTNSTARLSISNGGNVGIGTTGPLAGLHVDTPESGSSTALGVIASGGTTGNPSIELRGSSKTPYVDFAETTGVDYSTRVISQGGTLNVQTSTAAVPALAVTGYTKLTGANTTAAPAIAYARLTATLPAGANQQTIVALPAGVTQVKVLGLTGIVGTTASAAANLFPPNNGVSTAGSSSYQLYLFNNQVIISTDGNSANVYSQPIRILITYEQ